MKKWNVVAWTLRYIPKGKRTKTDVVGASDTQAIEGLRKAWKCIPQGGTVVKVFCKLGEKQAYWCDREKKEIEMIFVPVIGHGYSFRSIEDIDWAVREGRLPCDFPENLKSL